MEVRAVHLCSFVFICGSNDRMLWETPHRTFDFRHRGAIMGVVNVTPDSFSDGGRFIDVAAAVAHARQLAAQGAEIIDIGGESTRPGAASVSEEEELRRVIPVIEACTAGRWPAPGGDSLAGGQRCVLSIDTMKPAVARAAVRAGAAIINDVSGLRDPAMIDVAVETGAAVIAMHMQGQPRDMQIAPHYEDVCAEIREFFRQTYDRCLACGMTAARIAFDPGIGFGKALGHNLALLRHLDTLRVAARPLVLGVSRKSFLGKVLGSADLADREWPTVALTSYGRAKGANVIRVHSARPNVEALRMTEAILPSEAA
jgi:dihydropteroate synthase